MTTRRLALGVLAALVAVGGVGCGDDPGEIAAPAPTTTEAPRTTAPPTTASSWATTTPPESTDAEAEEVGDEGDDATTTTDPTASPTIESLQSADVPALCDHDETTLEDGRDPDIDPDEGALELVATLPDGGPGAVRDLGSTIGPLTVAVVSCRTGDVRWPHALVAYGPDLAYYETTFLTGERADDRSWESAWGAAGLEGPAPDGIQQMRRAGSNLEVEVEAYARGDQDCCPSARARVTIRPAWDRFSLLGITRLDAADTPTDTDTTE